MVPGGVEESEHGIGRPRIVPALGAGPRIDHATGHAADARIVVVLCVRPDEVRVGDPNIVVQKEHDLTARGGKACVQRRDDVRSSLVDQPNVVGDRGEERPGRRRVLRGLVDDDDLQLRIL